MTGIFIVDSHGFKLGKKGQRIVVNWNDGRREEISVKKLSIVVISGSGSVSTQAMQLLADNNIPVVFTSRNSPYATMHPFFMHGTVLTRREQMRSLDDHRGLHLAKAFVYSAIMNKVRTLRYFIKSRVRTDPLIKDDIEEFSKKIEEITNKLIELDGNLQFLRSTIMGLEGESANLYYRALSLLLPDELGFKGRDRRPPKDPVNSVLSYGYTVLTSIVLLAIAKVGLEPFAGYLHVDRSGRPSLILDLSEEFRQPIIDVLVVSLFSKRSLDIESFDILDDGRWAIKKESKGIFFDGLRKRLQMNIRSADGVETTFERCILRQARNIVRYLLGRIPIYKPFIWKWW
ncbi:MAG: CRISPR-associated endonuclease Cas1 [Candidatus Njordarchaeia archaeon]